MKKVLVGLGILLSLLVVVATALPTILHAAGLHPVYEGPSVTLLGKRGWRIETTNRRRDHDAPKGPDDTAPCPERDLSSA